MYDALLQSNNVWVYVSGLYSTVRIGESLVLTDLIFNKYWKPWAILCFLRYQVYQNQNDRAEFKLCHEVWRRRYCRCMEILFVLKYKYIIAVGIFLHLVFFTTKYAQICSFTFKFEPPRRQYMRRQNSGQSLGSWLMKKLWLYLRCL